MPTAEIQRSWKQDPEGRRERILVATEAEIAKSGFRGVRTPKIARRARVSEGTIFNLFGSKEALLSEVGRRYGVGFARAIFGGDQLLEGEVDVEALIAGIFRYASRDPALLAAFLWLNDPVAGSAPMSALREETVREMTRQLANGVAQGIVPQLDPKIAAEVQFSMVEGTLRECFVRHNGRHKAAYRRELVRSLRAMLGQSE